MPKAIIIANWKMNPETGEEARQLFAAVAQGIQDVKGVEVVVCPPFIYIPQIQDTRYPPTGDLPKGDKIHIGSQDCFWEDTGAFTGEVSPAMLKNLGCSHVILGHSERKRNLGETLEMVAKKVKAALLAGLIPVVCIGEEIEKEMNVIFPKGQKLILVYEPEWAISTAQNAKPATPEHAQKAIAQIKKIAGAAIPVLYGGSTDSKNIRSFIASGAQGVLVGSASLNAKEFIALVKNAVSA